MHMVDQWPQAVGVLASIHVPIRQGLGVVIAIAEPAVIQNEPFGPQIGRNGGDLFQFIQLVVEIDCFPAIVMDRARNPSSGNDLIPRLPLETDRCAVETVCGIGCKQGRGVERPALALARGCVAELDLPASIGKFLGDPPRRYEAAMGAAKLEGAIFEVDSDTGRCRDVQLVRLR